jgi:hypothetical protein
VLVGLSHRKDEEGTELASRVVLLGVRRLSGGPNGRAGGQAVLSITSGMNRIY